MSSTSTKNILLSQRRVGIEEVSPRALTHTVSSTEEATVIEVEVPGVDPSTIEVNCEANSLTIDCPRGRLIVPVDPTTDASQVSADILWGLLTVTVPQPPSPVAQSIKVNVVGQNSFTKKPAPHKPQFTDKD